MQHRTLGRTGVRVSALALGAMNFGPRAHTTQDEATAIVDTALEAGVNLIDTADAYDAGASAEEYGLGVLTWSPLASGWLSGAIRDGREINTNRSTVMPRMFDMSIPANRAKLDAVERLVKVADEAGLTMIQLALGFVTTHPAVTCALIGPRTLDHLSSQLAAADTVLTPDVLDAIGAIAAPGVDLAADERHDTPPALLDPSLRRR